MEHSKDKRILERVEKALDLIENSEVDEGLVILKDCEEVLSNERLQDSDLGLLISHNLALCYQLTQDYEECCEYLEKTIRIAKQREFNEDMDKIRNVRYLAMLLIQQGAIYSHLGDHDDSISVAKQSFNYISQSFSLCVQSAAQTKNLSSINLMNLSTLETCLSYLTGKIPRFPQNCAKIIKRSSLGVIHFTDWIYSFTMNDILDIKPLRYFEIRNSHTFIAELSKDFMLEKVCLLLSSCYLIATETRLHDDLVEVKKAKGWHMKAVEIGSVLLPMENPLFQHIKSSFAKHYPTIVHVVKTSKSKTPVKSGRVIVGKNKITVRPRGVQRKVIKDIEVKTDRSYVKDRVKEKEKPEIVKFQTQREENREPEPPISEDYDNYENNRSFIINSNDLYGIISDDD